MICHRCLKESPAEIHTCTPTDFVRDLETRLAECQESYRSVTLLNNTLLQTSERAKADLAECQKDGEEQARLLGMSGSREARLLAELEQCQRERDEFEEQRDAAWFEIRKIRVALGAKLDEATADEVDSVVKQQQELRAACQMALDALPKECPDDFILLGQYYAESLTRFAPPDDVMSKFKHKWINDCRSAVAKLREVLK